VELAGRFSSGFLSGIDRSLKLPVAERWQEAGEWLEASRGGPPTEIPSIVTPRTESSPVSAEIPGKKVKPPLWVIAPCVFLGLYALMIIKLNREPNPRAEAVADEAAIQSERENTPSIGDERDFEIAPGVKITMCWIPPGEFMMGSPVGEAGRDDDETQHRVKISNGFWLAKTETTQAQWRAAMGNNPSYFKGDNLPVERLSWNDIVGPGGFIEKINQAATATGESRFSLPTEAQWEYACRAGTTGAYAGDLDQMAWYGKNSDSKTHPVGGKKANAWGLQDMHGNVWELCADGYAAHPSGAVTDPMGAASGSRRVCRGGGWSGNAEAYRVANRYGSNPVDTSSLIGFRIARSSVP
jgi:formylglycine-generating enzyme required for sulfatase activity